MEMTTLELVSTMIVTNAKVAATKQTLAMVQSLTVHTRHPQLTHHMLQSSA